MSLTLHAKETALVLIDLEKGIVGRDLAPYLAKDVVDRSAKLAGAVRAAGGTVVYVHVLLHEIAHLPADRPMSQPGSAPPPPELSELVPDAGYQPETDNWSQSANGVRLPGRTWIRHYAGAGSRRSSWLVLQRISVWSQPRAWPRNWGMHSCLPKTP